MGKHDAEPPVVFAGIDDGVVVRTGEDALADSGRLSSTPTTLPTASMRVAKPAAIMKSRIRAAVAR